MMTYIYRLIILYLISLLCVNMMREKKLWMQLTAALLLVPWLLRLLFIK